MGIFGEESVGTVINQSSVVSRRSSVVSRQEKQNQDPSAAPLRLRSGLRRFAPQACTNLARSRADSL